MRVRLRLVYSATGRSDHPYRIRQHEPQGVARTLAGLRSVNALGELEGSDHRYASRLSLL